MSHSGQLEVAITYRVPEPAMNKAAVVSCGLSTQAARTLRPGHKERVPGIAPGGSYLVAGARFAPDSEQLSTITAHWRYRGVKHAEREMVRVGLGA